MDQKSLISTLKMNNSVTEVFLQELKREKANPLNFSEKNLKRGNGEYGTTKIGYVNKLEGRLPIQNIRIGCETGKKVQNLILREAE